MDKRIFKHARKFHKWLGYLLALQIFAWLLGWFNGECYTAWKSSR